MSTEGVEEARRQVVFDLLAEAEARIAELEVALRVARRELDRFGSYSPPGARVRTREISVVVALRCIDKVLGR
jgi:hypothetical protein